jgi:WhiB family redox-sensing transcriptional regulator
MSEARPGPDITILWRWEEHAACKKAVAARKAEQSWWFPESGADDQTAAAKAICETCPVKEQCLKWALKHSEKGIWGGLGEKQRQKIRRRTRDCLECGKEFTFDARDNSGGRFPDTCSEKCHTRRRVKQHWDHYERSGKADHVGKYIELGHGTISRYQSGCRCHVCKKVSRQKRAEYRAASA